MYSLVVLEMRRLRELHATYVTLVRFLSTMHSAVVLKISLPSKGETTYFTLEWFISCMKSLVTPQRRITGKSTITDITMERFVYRTPYSSYKYNSRAIALVTFGNSGHTTSLHRMMARLGSCTRVL